MGNELIWIFAMFLGRSLCSQHIAMPYLSNYSHYCMLFCYVGGRRVPNVACYFAPCLPSYRCGEEHARLSFNDTERQYISDRHNQIRNDVSSSDMLILSYDKELEFLASCWANQCMDSPRPSHGRDACRATTTFSYNGQNHWAYAVEDEEIDWQDIKYVEGAIRAWYEQKMYTSPNVIKSYEYYQNESHEFYTQMVWSDTFLVGCGRTRFSTGRYTGVNIVCNYSPGGNLEDKPVYNEGTPCSRYPNMTTNWKYFNLCGNERPLSDDIYEPPFTLRAVKTNLNFLLLKMNVLIALCFSVLL